MLALGTNVSWKAEGHVSSGKIVDCYVFTTEKYQSKYSSALLIKCVDGTYVLKLEKELKQTNDDETGKRKF